MHENFNSYKVEHLFLLMGENPLPNAVAALTLLTAQGTPYLVHTKLTKSQAQHLAKVLAETSIFKPIVFVDLDQNQAEPFIIRQRIREKAESLVGRVGMNYTGGTKAMAVHAYRVLEQMYPDAVFSYLDSNTLEMTIDSDTVSAIHFKPTPKLSFQQLFDLHGLNWRSQNPPLKEPILPEAASDLARLFRKRNIAIAWRKWCDKELRRFTKDGNDHWKSESTLERLAPLSFRDLQGECANILINYLGADTRTGTLSLQKATSYGFSSITQVCEWLDGQWLEHYVLSQIQVITRNCKIHESGMSFRITDPKQGNSIYEKFEFDVAFLRHYQLFALSCTTSTSRSLCKQKLIEASVRARQLGGIEARVALVCCYNTPDSLRTELEVETRNRKIAVFGREDLDNLSQRIINWVQQNN